jgi:multidrug resistance efflux pump
MQLQLERAELTVPRALAIDVVRIGKGNKYRIVVSDLDLGRPIWVGDSGRKEADLDQFFQTLGENQSGAIEVVSMDTWKSFRSSVVKNSPQARIVHDKFHVLRHLSSALDEVRRSEFKRLRGEQGVFVRGQFYSLLSKRENLNLEGGQALKKRLSANRRVHAAEILKDTFSQLWDYQNAVDALTFFEHWKEGLKRQRLEPYLRFAEYVESHWEGIAGHFDSECGIKPGLVAEINTRIHALTQSGSEPGAGETFRLQVISAFLPPLPASADASPAPPHPADTLPLLVVEDGNATVRLSLQGWLKLLCHMLPQVGCGIVVLVEEGLCQPDPVCWPPQSVPSDALLQAATAVVSQAQPVVQEGLFAQPLRLDGHLFAVAVIELAVTAEQQSAVLKLLDWGEQWLRLLLTTGAPTVADAGGPLNAPHNFVPLLEQVLRAEPLQAAVLAVSNQLAELFACERVVVGLLRGKRLRVQGLSHGGEFDARTSLIQQIEETMEVVRQSAEMALWPPQQETNSATKTVLELLWDSNGQRPLCVMPLMGRQGPIGAVLCERSQGAEFNAADQEALLIAGRLLGPLLERQEQQSAALMRPQLQVVGRWLDQLIKPGHRGLKMSVAGALFALLVLVFGQGGYRVSSPATVEGLVQRVVVAPFDGYIAEADVRAGDTVQAGDILARLDNRELLLELRKSASEEERLNNEYRRALAGLDRSEGRIVQARLAQVQAQSRLLQQKLARVQLTAPLTGMVISGDLSRSLGAPVERGQVLFEVAPLAEYRLVLAIDEQEISHVSVGQTGSLSLTALPHERWNFVIEQVSPVFQELDGQVSYRIEARIEGGVPALRPGMEGVGKVEVGHRSFGWILFHKMFDWLRLQMWLWLP